MTRLSKTDHSDEPLRLTDDDRIRMCGRGAPTEQYRTPAIGAGFVIDLHRTLLAWHGAPPDLRDMLETLSPRRRRYPADIVLRCARALVQALAGDAAVPTPNVRATLAKLSDVVIRANLTDGVVLSCVTSMHGPRVSVFAGVVTAQDAALALVTTVCTRRPTVMWGIEPSLDSLTIDGLLRVRWLNRDRAGSNARTAWDTMLRITSTRVAHV